ncbi:MAG TPA: protease SohB, partial [Pseudomonadales bacterium]|nr:protease SohB [Pseudomonadales bacterium]
EKKRHKEEAKVQKQEAKSGDGERKPRVYVVDFEGDVQASGVSQLREEVTAILSVAEDKDEVIVRLESPGGIVHGYGLGASQLSRIVGKSISLTVAVDKVAASGGYMMACIANRLIAAPFAILGSIGVVAQIPNFHRLLKNKDIDVEVLTAGEYKRTLTIFGENTEKGREKFIEELEDVHLMFKDFVAENRPGI